MNKLYLLLGTAFLLRLFLSPFLTYELDQNTFIAWAQILNQQGLNNFYYSGWSDYLPGYLYILRLLSSVENLLPISRVMLYKLPAILADIVTGLLIFKISQKNLSQSKSLLASSLFLFNPAILINSTLWGQVDSFTSLFALSSIYFLNSASLISIVSLALGASIKPQIAMALPVVLALMISDKWKFKRIFFFFILTALIFILIFIPFSKEQNIIGFIFSRIDVTLNQYKYNSVNAFNFWGLFGFWKPDTSGLLSSKIVGDILVIWFSLFAFFRLLKDKKNRYLYLSLLFWVNFLFMTRMHERHLLAAFAPLAIVSITRNMYLVIYSLLSVIYLLNMYYGYSYVSADKYFVLPEMFIRLIIFLNLLLFTVSVFLVGKKKEYKLNIKFFKANKSHLKLKDKLTKKHTHRLLMLILLFSLLTRVANLSNPKEDYFDEIYHAFSARTLVDGDPGLWSWDSDSPEGFAYEWSHPPLNKEVMAINMKIFGINSFNWRIPGVLLGVAIVYLTFKLSYILTKSRDASLLSAFLVSIDGLMFTMSRIGTADIYLVFFALLTIYFYHKDKYFLSSLSLGLAASTKWSAIWILPILVVSHLSLRRKIFDKRLLFFMVIPAMVYLASYSPMFYFGHGIEHFWGMQKQMWWYHSGLNATHPYSSDWWTWPLNYRPVYLYQLDNNNGQLGNIYAMGNPLVFWFGLISVGVSSFYLIRNRAPKALGLALFSYFSFFATWAISPRIMFIYHYLPAIPFMAIISGYIIKRHSWLIIPVCFTGTMLFVYFYPHWTGLEVPIPISKSYYWLSSWR